MSVGEREVATADPRSAPDRGRTVSPASPVEHGPALASVGARGLAQVVDGAALLVVGGAIAVASGQVTAGGVHLTGGSVGLWVAVAAAYFVALEARGGQTIGKRLLGIAVRHESGGPAGLAPALVRNLLRPVDFVACYVVGVTLAADSELRQRLGDRVAATVVVEVP